MDILIAAASPAVRMILAREMKAIASHSLLPTASLKIIMAITEVAAISKLPKRAAVLEFVMLIPIIKLIGAAISSNIIKTTKGISFFVSLASVAVGF